MKRWFLILPIFLTLLGAPNLRAERPDCIRAQVGSFIHPERGQFELTPLRLGDSVRLREITQDPRVRAMSGTTLEDEDIIDLLMEAQSWKHAIPPEWRNLSFGIRNQPEPGMPPRLDGFITLFHHRPAQRRAEIGFVLAPEQWGHGIMPVAASQFLHWAERDLGLRRLDAITLKSNIATQKTLERLGFQKIAEENHVEFGQVFRYERRSNTPN